MSQLPASEAERGGESGHESPEHGMGAACRGRMEGGGFCILLWEFVLQDSAILSWREVGRRHGQD